MKGNGNGVIWSTAPLFVWREREKPRKSINQDNRFPNRDSNPSPHYIA
jgi:hypothetical protein